MNPEPFQPYQIDFDALRERIPDNLGETLQEIFSSFYFWLQVVSLFASLFLIVGIVYAIIRTNQIRKAEREELNSASRENLETVPTATVINPRWERIKELLGSENQNDWRHAILEADIMLDEMVARMQYSGETLGERLKQVEKSDFNTIDNAWEAHKIRNQIAHEGSDFILSKREAERAIRLYESVFREFHFI